MTNPLLAITMGDPAGVGPETIVGAWRMDAFHQNCRAVAIGHPAILRRAAMLFPSSPEVVEISAPEEADSSVDRICCLSCGGESAADVPPSVIDPRGGQAAFDCLTLGAELALAGRVDGIVTAPLHKAALWAAGHHYPGHTELLAELCGVDDFAMMLYLPRGERVAGRVGLGVAHVTLHMALREVFDRLTPESILATARLADVVTRSFLDETDAPPRIGVCALNPHAGEEGLFGDEESRIIAPAVERGRAEGMNLQGPLPTDTLMGRAASGEFDAVVAMYHDQGHIALKLLDMHQAVNITLGLPIVRTSVAHGTAFDLAWQGRAQVGGMIEAVKVAASLASRRTRLNWRSLSPAR